MRLTPRPYRINSGPALPPLSCHAGGKLPRPLIRTTMKGKLTLYRDQYGQTFTAKTVRELRSKLRGRVSKMYVDKKDGGTVCVGYVIGQHWLTAFQPVEIPA